MIIRIGCLLIFTTLISINFVNADPADVTINHKEEIKVNTPLRITVQVTMDGSPVENANVLLYVVNPYGESEPLTDYTDQNGKAALKYIGADVIGQYFINTSVKLNGVWIGGCPASIFNVR